MKAKVKPNSHLLKYSAKIIDVKSCLAFAEGLAESDGNFLSRLRLQTSAKGDLNLDLFFYNMD